MSQSSYERAYEELLCAVEALGFPAEFGQALAAGLGKEKTIQRMTGYLLAERPKSMEVIADEMVSLVDQRTSWVERKKHNYYQEKLNEFYNRERDGDERACDEL